MNEIYEAIEAICYDVIAVICIVLGFLIILS